RRNRTDVISAAPDPEPPSSEDDDLDADSDSSRSGSEGRTEPESGEELDPLRDPLAEPGTLDIRAWERLALGVQPRIQGQIPEASQRLRVRSVLQTLKQNEGEPTEAEAETLARDLHNIATEIPVADEFVAGNFARNRAAWEEMLRGNNSRAARRVRSWLRQGFKPTFARADSAKPQKRKVVEGMLRKQYPNAEAEAFLTGDRPHRASFKNHRSFY
ncbi:hypothetical protein KFL_014330010, partial [Klebsormidium nitens]